MDIADGASLLNPTNPEAPAALAAGRADGAS
jgi:hypothetical protein